MHRLRQKRLAARHKPKGFDTIKIWSDSTCVSVRNYALTRGPKVWRPPSQASSHPRSWCSYQHCQLQSCSRCTCTSPQTAPGDGRGGWEVEVCIQVCNQTCWLWPCNHCFCTQVRLKHSDVGRGEGEGEYHLTGCGLPSCMWLLLLALLLRWLEVRRRKTGKKWYATWKQCSQMQDQQKQMAAPKEDGLHM